MTQREEFEAWFISTGHEKTALNRHKFYVEGMVEEMWMAWKAAKAQGVPQWIPVSERLPDEGVLCIVFGVNGVVNNHFEYYKPTHIQGYFDSVIDGCVLELDEVTHWMPLPAAPEQQK